MADDDTETAVLAGGCAWIMQQLLRHPEGVVSTRTGFMGGTIDDPPEENDGGHAEVVEVVFDPERLSYRSRRKGSRATNRFVTVSLLPPTSARHDRTEPPWGSPAAEEVIRSRCLP